MKDLKEWFLDNFNPHVKYKRLCESDLEITKIREKIKTYNQYVVYSGDLYEKYKFKNIDELLNWLLDLDNYFAKNQDLFITNDKHLKSFAFRINDKFIEMSYNGNEWEFKESIPFYKQVTWCIYNTKDIDVIVFYKNL